MEHQNRLQVIPCKRLVKFTTGNNFKIAYWEGYLIRALTTRGNTKNNKSSDKLIRLRKSRAVSSEKRLSNK